jgi:hypothetical protein
MRRFSLLVLVLCALLSVSALAAQDEQKGASLQVVDSEPFTGQELGLDSSITLYFDRPVNCDTAKSAITITPAVPGDITCADSSVTFKPSQPFARATRYTVQVGTGLQGADGAKLVEPYTLDVNTVGYLTVSDTLPANGATGVEADTVVTAIFNRPVVPLVSAEEAGSVPSPITIQPEVKGKGEWLNTSIYVFRPDTAFAGGSQYTVTIDPNLKAVDGSTLEKPVTWSFTTVEPAIDKVVPEAQSANVPLENDIQVKFNQPMDKASAEAAFYLRPQGTTANIPGKFTWADDNAGFSFQPNENLKLDTVYEAGFNAGVKSAGGGALTGFQSWTLATVPAPAIIGTDPTDGATDVTPYGSFSIYFASPMDIKSLKDKVTVDPKPWRDPEFYYNEYDNSYQVSFPVEPSTNYTITIAPGMKDKYGNVIEQGKTIKYTTAAYDPNFQLQVPGEIGFYNAKAKETQLFLTHRNISRLDLQLYAVPLDRFVQAISADSYSPATNLFPDEGSLLRSWQMSVDNKLNQTRFELLKLGSTAGGAVECPGAPASRLHVGDVAVVTSDPDPVTARENPPDGARVTSLYKGYQLSVVGGPVCANNILWWQVQLRDQKKAWVAEGANGEYYLDVRVPGQTTEVTVEPTANGGALRPGIYLLRANAPELANQNIQPISHFLMVSTANLTMKYGVDSVLVWATDAQTGAPIGSAPVTLYDKNDQAVGQGTTDANGLVTISIPHVTDLYTPMTAVLQSGDQFGISNNNWSNGIEPWQFGQFADFYPQQYRTYLYTDRPIYRPNQPVYFRGVVRQRDDVKYTPPSFKSVPVKIYDTDGNIVYDNEVPLTPFGTFSDKFDIASDAPLGYYRIEAQMPLPENAPDGTQPETGNITFGVAEFRLPEFQVNVTPEKDQVVQGDTIKVTVDSKYFFGGVVSNAKVDYTVIARPYFYDYRGPGYYDFQDIDYDAGPSEIFSSGQQEIANGSGTTDAQGKLTIEVPAALKDATISQTFTIEATVTDESQQVVAGRADVIVHKGLVYIGASPEEYVSTAKQETKVNLLAVNWEGNGVPNQKIDVKVVERRWSNVQEQDETGRTTYTWKVDEIPVTTGEATTDAQGKAVYSFTPPNGGIFKVTISTRDEKGNEIVAATTLWVAGEEYVSWRQQNSNRIDLVADKKDYQVGDTASILITSPFQGTAEALVTVERGRVLTSERVTLTSNSYVYKLPITPDFAPNIYVNVLIVKGVDDKNPVAAFRAGMVQLPVDNQQKEITIQITPDKQQAGPRETVTYTVKTTDYQGKPVQAEVGVGLTDLASLSIADPNSGPLLGFYYGQQGLAIRTATPLTINVDQLTQTVLDTIKGGGGGGGEGGIFDIRQDFVDTAYWNATVVTGADGTATFQVKLPDNLTTWRLDARAVTSGADGLTLVGQNTFDLLSTKPLLIRPVTPRFFVVGDEVTLAAIVNNNTGADMPVEVHIEGTGVTFRDKTSQTFTIPSGGRQRVEWPVTINDVANIDLTFFANGNNGAFTDASKPPLGQGDNRLLPVYKYEVPETVGTGGVLRAAGSRTEAIALPKRFDVTQGELSISVDLSLAATTIDGLNYLRTYPYDCIEQTVSKFLPNIMTYRALDQLGVANDTLKSQLDSAANFALQRLYAQQKVDGGWGWFVQDESNPTTTAYALIGLAEAKSAGFAVSDNVIANAQNYLRTTFIVPGPNQPTWRLNRQAFVLYALARSGAPDVARTSTLYDNRANLSYYAKAFLALTFNRSDAKDTSRSDTLVSDLFNGAVTSATGIHWEEKYQDYWNWNTDTRTTAIVLDALVKLKPNSDLLPNGVRWLMVARKADAWETTQETAWAVMSLTDWMVSTGELKPNYSFSASINGAKLTEGQATTENVRDSIKLKVDVKDLLKDQANNLVIGRTEGAGVLYYTAHLRAFLPVPEVQPLDRGIIVDRRYYDKDGKVVTQARVGDVLQVRLTIIAPNDLYYAVVEDPIPAGTEAINPDLKTEQQVGTQPSLNAKDPLSEGWGWWWFSNIEFRDQKVVLFSSYLPAGTYEFRYSIRAGLPGTFNVIPPTGQEFYFPEVYGRGAGSTFTVLPAE